MSSASAKLMVQKDYLQADAARDKLKSSNSMAPVSVTKVYSWCKPAGV